MNLHNALTAVATCIVLELASTSAVASPKNERFTIKEVKVNGDRGFHGIALNDSAQVVLVTDTDGPDYFYTGPNGKGISGAPPAIIAAGKATGRLTGINNAGQVSGSFKDCVCTKVEHAFVTSPDGSTFSDFEPAGETGGFAAAVDAKGRVAISGTTETGIVPHFTEGYRSSYDKSSIDALHGFGNGVIVPKAIASGVIVGEAQNGAGSTHAFKTLKDGAEIFDLGTFGGANSSAAAVNKFGAIAGTAEDSAGVQHAFITDADGSLRRLDGNAAIASSQAFGIDAQGRVVGCYVRTGNPFYNRAFVTEPNGGEMHDLNSLFHSDRPLVLGCAFAINANGQILADEDSGEHGPFVLTPTK